MAEKIIRVGIAGQGRSGFDIHARWLREAPHQYKIVAVADALPQRRAQAAKEFSCRTYKDYKELIAQKDLDLFINALPSFLHPSVTTAALKAGHNVVSEKPAATKVVDFDKVVAAATKARRLYAQFQNSRFYPFFVKLQDIIASGVIGRVLHISANWSGYARRWDWQTMQEKWGGNLNNTGPHPLDQAIMLFGPKMPNVFCRMVSGPNTVGDADDLTMLTFYGKGSPIIDITISSYQAYGRGEMYNVCGTCGGITGGPRSLKWKYFDPKKVGKLKLWKPWSLDRQYCKEDLPWVEETWTAPTELDDFQHNSRAFYNNIYDVLVNKAELIVKPEQVRRQVAVIEECHRQNKLPNMKNKKWC